MGVLRVNLLNWFKGLKLWAVMGGVIVALLGLLKITRLQKKAAELEANQEKENRKNLENAKKVVEDIQERRQEWDAKQAETTIERIVELEDLKNEEDDNIVVDTLLNSMHKDNNKT